MSATCKRFFFFFILFVLFIINLVVSPLEVTSYFLLLILFIHVIFLVILIRTIYLHNYTVLWKKNGKFCFPNNFFSTYAREILFRVNNLWKFIYGKWFSPTFPKKYYFSKVLSSCLSYLTSWPLIQRQLKISENFCCKIVLFFS